MAADPDEVRLRMAAAEAELDRFRVGRSAGSGMSAVALGQSMVDLRHAAERASHAAM